MNSLLKDFDWILCSGYEEYLGFEALCGIYLDFFRFELYSFVYIFRMFEKELNETQIIANKIDAQVSL